MAAILKHFEEKDRREFEETTKVIGCTSNICPNTTSIDTPESASHTTDGSTTSTASSDWFLEDEFGGR